MNYIKLFTIILTIFSLSGCQLIMPVEYKDTDGEIRSSMTSDEKVWHALNVIDTAQTIHLARSPDCFRESNFLTKGLIGEHPSTGQVVAIGLLYSLAYRAANQFVEDRITYNEDGYYANGWGWVKVSLSTIGILTKAYTVTNNHIIGMKPLGSGC